jgi:hypothetical protein
MRSIIKPFEPSAIPISDIYFDPQSRDDIPQVLRGLQYIYTNPETCQAVFDILKTVIPPEIEKKQWSSWYGIMDYFGDGSFEIKSQLGL